MPISPYVRRLRERVGSDLLLLPSVSVLPRDGAGRVLLVRHADGGQWGTIGGAVEIDEEPTDAAVREAREETAIEVRLIRLAAVLGGPEFRVTYSNGDQAAYVTTVYEAEVAGGRPQADNDEVVDVDWVAPADLASLDLTPLARAMFAALGLVSERN
jgi:8-oxo-dGTP pyrophosphatase MutT (NUDIX family)